jgi:glutamate synthase domain-containing protein 3
MKVSVNNMNYRELNGMIAGSDDTDITLDNVYGQRFIASGVSGKNIAINGTPGNALGCFMNGCKVIVNGNAQDQVGDTMNDGSIVIYGNCGDAGGYAMRGGEIFIRDNAGYRLGIHMKEYKEKRPAIIGGGKAGSFLGEYQAGGVIIILNLHDEDTPAVDEYIGIGMHGGAIYIRGKFDESSLKSQINHQLCESSDLDDIRAYLTSFCEYFDFPMEKIFSKPFSKLCANSRNPYKQLYIDN